MPFIENVHCCISTASGALKEYYTPDLITETRNSLDTVQSCYIQSHESHEFTITVATNEFAANHHYTSHLLVRLSFDGVLHTPPHNLVGMDKQYTWKSLATTAEGHEVHKNFKFCKLAVTEDAVKAEGQGVHAEELGEIKVHCYRYRHKKMIPATRAGDGAAAFDAAEKVVHEKQLKGKDIAHVVGAGREKIQAQLKTVSAGEFFDDPDGTPYMTFRFLYRTERALRGLGVITRSPSPEIVEVSHRELRRVRRSLASFSSGNEADPRQAWKSSPIKRERARSGTPVVKTAERVASKRCRNTQRVVVDLTDD